ncbi:MAG: class I SAM-dependent methyltransferase [Candidatus Daviesbacteria bacterium]|nr:MAG: class I SAM-dependent methyltransferase [Candidatus Daviesbacteria bacterium]
MKNRKYQLNYAADRPQMYDQASRIKKAERIVKLLADFFGKNNLKNLSVLDIGASSGIIDHFLAQHFKEVTGADIDEKAIKFAKESFKRKNLKFEIADAMNLKYKNNSFDVVICTHVYEHVPHPKKLFTEIRRVLTPNGVCYLAAVNKLWPLEPHYDLPFLSWLPKSLANYYVRFTGKANQYYETLFSYWTLKKLTKEFNVFEFTDKILREPTKFGFNDTLPEEGIISLIVKILSPLGKYFAPTFFWVLQKTT